MFAPEIRILVVDDSSTSREILKGMLKKLGFSRFVECMDGEKSVETLIDCEARGEPVDLIISDIRMPRMDGLQLLNFVRKAYTRPNVPVILVTAEGEKKTVIEAIKAGATSYLLKPFTPDDVKSCLEKTWRSVRRAD